MVRSMMSQTTLPKSFWDYALETAARILNMVPSKKVDKTPYEIWHGQAPKLSYLRVWGCEAFVKHDTLTKPDKLDPRSYKCIFVGYPKETMGYSFYSPSENKVFVARNAEFFESKLLDLKASGSVEDLEEIQEEDTNPSVETSLNHEEDDQEIDEPQSDINPIRRSTRTRRPTDRLCLYIDTEEHELGDLGEPANYRAALLDPESKKWLDAMNVEMQSMKDNDVWVLVELPPNARTVGSKWLFKKKTDMDGAVYIFKARLVAKGFTQTYGVDYEETFSPVADIRAIRILIAIAAYYDYEIWQMDVKTAFLNGHLSEEVYMEQPEGFVNPKYPNHVCKLKRSIYGLKQASRQWNKRFDDEIKKFGFTQNPDEPCVYQKSSRSYVAILILYVDDILLMGNNIPMLQDVKSYLGRSFAMKDLGDAAYILGIKIYRDRSKRLIGLCQSAYIEKILKRYYMENSKRGTIPMQEKLKLSKSQGREMMLLFEDASNGSRDDHMRKANSMTSLFWARHVCKYALVFEKFGVILIPENMNDKLKVIHRDIKSVKIVSDDIWIADFGLSKLKICANAACGLDYLRNHIGGHRTIIYRDIKSSNILMDEIGLLSVTGFGRSVIGSNGCGTQGYCEPQYYTSGVVTKKSDVYSFGIVLFDVLCGRLCIIELDNGFILSGKSVKEYYNKGNLVKIIDPSLREYMDSYSMTKFSEIAYRCLHDD
ncbi:retrotransposon protein, putative, ty1-copia subclass [Tanacetum coccineum]